MKKSILLLIFATMAMGAIARSVSSEMAVTAANAWAARNGQFGAGAQASGEVRSVRDPENAAVVLWHQVSMRNGGMLVIAPVTEIEPVVMALDNDPGDLPAAHPLRGILVGDLRRRLRFLGLYPTASTGASLQGVTPPGGGGASAEAKAWGEACNTKWAKLTANVASLQEASTIGLTSVAVEVRVVEGFEQGGALTHWTQKDYGGAPLYNLYTPGNVVCGCVATATSALAQFYGAKAALPFSNMCSYNGVSGSYQTLPGEIDWSILPANWGGEQEEADELTEEQRDLIGRVAYNAGVGVAMQWADGGSGAYDYDVAGALKKVFGFKNARWVPFSDSANPSQAALEKLVYNQCRAGVPVGMSIDLHSVVACGYGLDSEGVERVRVFMGWAGKGDGWYALPKIDTQSLPNGPTYLSEIIDGVTPMLSCNDGDIVPIVGHVEAPGAELTMPALNRTIVVDDNGYFGTRVPAGAREVEVVCKGRSAFLTVGAASKTSSNVDELCAADVLPVAFEFELMNASVAYSLKRAKSMAEQEGKAILRVSGPSEDDPIVAAVREYIHTLDDGNVNGFVDKFVYTFAPSSSGEGDGANVVSFGVYLPSELTTEDRWQSKNGNLAYGYSSLREWATNVLTVTVAPARVNESITSVTNDAANTEAILAAVLQSLETVLDVGAKRFAECTSGISVIVNTTDSRIAAVTNENCYTSGAAYTFTCDAVVTNGDFVLGCSGWSLTNATTGATRTGTGSTAVLEFATNDVVTLTWDLSKTNAVWVTVDWTDTSVITDPATVTPGSGWYPYGEPVVFEAVETAVNGKYGFNGWDSQGVKVPEGATVLQPPNRILVPMVAPGQLRARYRRGGTPQVLESTTLNVTTVSWFFDDATSTFTAAAADAAPLTTVYGAEGALEFASGDVVDVPVVGSAYLRAEEAAYVDASGKSWKLSGYYLGEMTGDEDSGVFATGTVHQVSFTANAALESVTINWLWLPEETEPTPDDVQTEYDIAWDDALSTLNAQTYSTNLCTVAALEANGLTLEDLLVTTPKGFIANVADDGNGNVVATLELDEGVLKPYAADGMGSPLTILSNGDGSVTVKADVANGVRGFWYTLYAADELGGAWLPVVAEGDAVGEPSIQAKADDVLVSPSITVFPTDEKRFYKLVVTDEKP